MDKIMLAGQRLRVGEVYQYISGMNAAPAVTGPGIVEVTFQAERRQATTQRRARGLGNFIRGVKLRGANQGRSTRTSGRREGDAEAHREDRRHATKQRRARGAGDSNKAYERDDTAGRTGTSIVKGIGPADNSPGRRVGDYAEHVERRSATKQRRARGMGNGYRRGSVTAQSKGGRRKGDFEAHTNRKDHWGKRVGGKRISDTQDRRGSHMYNYRSSADPRIKALERRKA